MSPTETKIKQLCPDNRPNKNWKLPVCALSPWRLRWKILWTRSAWSDVPHLPALSLAVTISSGGKLSKILWFPEAAGSLMATAFFCLMIIVLSYLRILLWFNFLQSKMRHTVWPNFSQLTVFRICHPGMKSWAKIIKTLFSLQNKCLLCHTLYARNLHILNMPLENSEQLLY